LLTGLWVRGSLNFQMPLSAAGVVGGGAAGFAAGAGAGVEDAAAVGPAAAAGAPGMAAGPAPACGKKNTATTITTTTPANRPSFASFAITESPGQFVGRRLSRRPAFYEEGRTSIKGHSGRR
jgi:hypothetical protein